MRSPMSRRVALLVCSLLVLGCSDSLAPEDVAGVYVLERIGSDPLPAVLFETEYGIVRVESESIRLRADGTGTVSSMKESIPWQDGHSATGPVWSERAIRFRTVAGRIEIEFVCAANESCLPGPHMVARLTSDGLWATYHELRTPLHYAKVVVYELR